jgi:hypothetical protein
MSDPKSQSRRSAVPIPALQALSETASDPVRRAFWLDALERRLRPCLPPGLADHCRLANVAKGKLVFLVDSPVWRAKLRLASPGLVDLAQSIGLAVTEATAKVGSLPSHPPSAPRRGVLPMSASSREALQAALASLDDPDSAGPDTAAKPPRRRKP